MMKKLYSLLFLYFLINLSFGQDNIWSHFRIDANLNYLNKKRSYGVYSDDKYANSGHYLGLDFGLHYETKLIDYGIEIFPYRHINFCIAYSGLEILRRINLKLKPDLKLGYSPILEKVYYGFGLNLNYKWFSLGYNKILHFKSGESKYHGDGIDGFSFGISLSKERIKKIFKAKSYKNSTNSFFFYD